MTALSRHLVNVSLSIQLEFYYNEYDWGVIYRQIGEGEGGSVGQNNKFYKVNCGDNQLIDDKYKPSCYRQSTIYVIMQQRMLIGVPGLRSSIFLVSPVY